MRRLALADVVLLGLALPVWVACFALHVREARELRFAWPGLYLAAPESPDAFPVYIGNLPGSVQNLVLEPGDRVLKLGDSDLRGIGPIGAIARAIEQRSAEGELPVTYERGGAVREDRLLVPAAFMPWWWYIPLTAGFALMGLLILMRAPEPAIARTGFLAAILFSLYYLRFYGGSLAQTYAWIAVYGVSVTACFPLGLRTVLLFPADVARNNAASRLAPWLFALLGPAIVSISFGVPFPADVALRLSSLLSIAFMATFLAVLTLQYRRTGAVGRRQIKWLVYGFYLVAMPAFACVGLSLYDPRYWWASEVLQISGSLAPVFILFVIARYHMLDIDRLISTTASYTLLSIGLLTSALTLVPRAAQAASEWFGVAPSFIQVTLSIVLASIAVPLHKRLRPQIERRFFPERRALEQGIQQLLCDLSDCADPRALLSLAGERLDSLLKPQSCVIFARAREAYVPVFVRGRSVPLAFEGHAPLIATLAAQARPLQRRGWSRRGPPEQLSPFERAALETMDAAVLAPVLSGSSLLAFVSLGGKRSGDIYTTTDLALIGAVADRLSSELRRFDDQELLRRKLEMYQQLRRYVPSRLAAQLEAGESLEPRELEVSVLFIDLWGYTAFSERHRPEEVFAAVNRYAETVSLVVRELGGTLVEFAGDGVMVVFGAPEPLPDKERAAVRAAVALVEAVAALGRDGEAPARAGVGVATGRAIVGSIRAVDRTLWSAIGNTTNLAARLQQMTRELDAAVVIDPPTHARSGSLVADFRQRRGMPVPGRQDMTDVYWLPAV
ncbi:MAG: adenylate/guanylate cyclase domain-containing protein [Myxococcota bacterium]